MPETIVLDRDAFAAYLNDHLAGSVAALKLIDRICDSQGQSALGEMMGRFRQEVGEEQKLLRELLRATGGSESTVARALGWLGEQVSRAKIGPGDGDASGLMLFEALEALTLGFTGRQSLWRVLEETTRRVGLPGSVDFAALERRAAEHLKELETARLDAGVKALTCEVAEVTAARGVAPAPSK